MSSSNQNSVYPSYNVQTTVDAKHKLLLDFKVTRNPNDLGELDNMAMRAKKLFGGKDFRTIGLQRLLQSTRSKKMLLTKQGRSLLALVWKKISHTV